MKRLIVATVALLTVCLTCLPVSAQNPNIFNSNGKFARNSVRYADLGAFTDGRGVWLGWKTEVETKNLGFYVYRIVDGQRELVSEALTPGAFLQAEEEKMTAGSYSLFDQFGTADSVYVIESLNTGGSKQYSSLIQTKTVTDLTAVAGASSEEFNTRANSVKPAVSGSESILPADLSAEVESNRALPDPAIQRWVASQPGVKIRVKNEGFYRIPRADLQSNGFDVNAPTEKWQLYVNGVEQAIIIGDGGSHIEFYGKGIDTLESESQVYFLVVGSQNGKRITSTVRRRLGGTVTTPSYAQVFYKKERFFYSQSILNGDSENIFGRIFNDTGATITFNLTGVDFNASGASIDVAIQGVTTIAHQVKVTLNNVDIGVIDGVGYDAMTTSLDISTVTLREGENTLKLTSLVGASDFSTFNSLSVRYARRYKAEQNRLSFYVPNYQATYLEGFTSPNIRVFDTTNSDAPVLINNLAVDQNLGNYRVYLPSNRGRILQAVENSGFLQPASIIQNTPSTLSSSGNSGDLIIISHKDFMTQAEAWAAYRRTQGLEVKVVEIEDVFDEFNFGVSKSDSIRSFLQFAKNSWSNSPEYVLLIGDASYDPKNYFGVNDNFVPTRLVDTIYSETSSDETLADFNDDGLAEIAIGRIPVKTGALVTMALNKTISFEQTVANGLARKVLFASDLPNGYDFEGVNDRLCAELPSSDLCVKLNRAQPNVNTLIVNEMNNGRFIVNYSGHGNVSGWATNAFFSNTQANQLNNNNKLSVYTLLTCLNGYYIGPTDSLTDALMKNPNGGAVVSWASSGLTTPDVQEVMATRFFNQIAAGNTTRIGDLIRDAKTTINFGRDVRLSWNLLGDPSLKVK